MPDTHGVTDVPFPEQPGHILAEGAPVVWRLRLAAAAVSAKVRSDAQPVGQARDNLVPAAGMKPGGVAKDDSWQLAWPMPDREIDVMDGNVSFGGFADQGVSLALARVSHEPGVEMTLDAAHTSVSLARRTSKDPD